VQFGGIGSAGQGNTQSYINQLARGQQATDGAVSSLMGGGGGVSAQRLDPNTQTQNVNELGTGFASQFMQNYNPMFEQQRQQALAAAKEASGNLTGSGFANALGNATQATLGQQQAQLASLAQFGIGQEMQRQQAGASLDYNRNAANAGNDLQAQIASMQGRLTGAQGAGQLGLGYGQMNQRGLESALGGEQMNLQREQGRLGQEADLRSYQDLQNRQISSGEMQSASEMDLRRLTGLAGFQQGDAQYNAGLAQNNNQWNAGSYNQRGDLQGQMNQQLGLANRGFNSDEERFFQQLNAQNSQFNAGQMNDMSNNNANRYTGLLGNMATAGVGTPQTYQQKNFFDHLAGGVNAAVPFMQGSGGSGAGRLAPEQTPYASAGQSMGMNPAIPQYTGGYYQTPGREAGMPNLSMLGQGNGMPAPPPNPMQQTQGFLSSLASSGTSGMGMQNGMRPPSTYMNMLPRMG
jgi:hypothetical protein